MFIKFSISVLTGHVGKAVSPAQPPSAPPRIYATPTYQF